MDIKHAMCKTRTEGILKGVCSTCQTSGIELIYEDENTVLQEHNAFGHHCIGSYSIPETVYRDKKISSLN